MPVATGVWSRRVFIALAVLTIAVGLAVHFGGGRLPADVRDITGDALWAMMMAWIVGALLPGRGMAQRALVALGICYTVEVSQLLHTPMLDRVRATTLGHLVLGSGFDPRDLAAYALGVLGAVALEWWWRRRRSA
jgi:hypothetical protein